MSGSVPSRSTSARGSKPRHADGRFVTPHPKQSFELPSTLGQSSSTLHRVPSTASPRSNTQETRSNATSIEAQEIMEAIRRSLDSSYDVKPLNAAVATKTREKGELNSEFPRAPAATGSPPSPAPIRIPVRSRSSSPSKSPSPIESIQAIEQELVNLEYDFTFPTTLDFLPPASLGSTPSLAYTTNNLPLRTYENKLSSLLARLDGVESEGSEDVRYARRDLVKRIEKILDDLEEKTKGLWGLENNDETPVEQTETEVSAEPTAGETEGIAVPTAQIIQLVDATTITVDAQEEVEGSTSHPVEVEENGNPSSTSDAIFDQTEDDNIAPEVDVNDMVKPIEPQLEVVVPQAQKSSDPTERVEARSPEPHLSSSSSESSLIQVPSDLEEEEGISDLGDESRNPDGALRDGDDDAAADGADDAAPPSMEESEMIEQTTDFVLL
ncbi:uncharacterized protein EI90DRAFT_3047094 [Cantharellus anzutake]|uniref:uncharacterized protein n=1 Tax=Cantharellus anzutake TaxID=1750568 RepID=UPI001904CFC5|nr:uncharacterized protein EI90DRAFT_3047094 [Cantharellus anzutake]KAF8335777.1 hypothetical protein EI90DRAFT_3047094 [Cantharellus anzutake]